MCFPPFPLTLLSPKRADNLSSLPPGFFTCHKLPIDNSRPVCEWAVTEQSYHPTPLWKWQVFDTIFHFPFPFPLFHPVVKLKFICLWLITFCQPSQQQVVLGRVMLRVHGPKIINTLKFRLRAPNFSFYRGKSIASCYRREVEEVEEIKCSKQGLVQE